jgi:uncharacterized protein (DUF1778 family)
MAVTILPGDIVKKEQVKSALAGKYGSNNQQIEQFICAVFDKREEITFQQFIIYIFQYIEFGLSERDQEALLSMLAADGEPNEALKRAAEKYKKEYMDEYMCGCQICKCLAPARFLDVVCSDCRNGFHGSQSHLCFDCSESCDCDGNKEDCDGCGCLK